MPRRQTRHATPCTEHASHTCHCHIQWLVGTYNSQAFLRDYGTDPLVTVAVAALAFMRVGALALVVPVELPPSLDDLLHDLALVRPRAVKRLGAVRGEGRLHVLRQLLQIELRLVVLDAMPRRCLEKVEAAALMLGRE